MPSIILSILVLSSSPAFFDAINIFLAVPLITGSSISLKDLGLKFDTCCTAVAVVGTTLTGFIITFFKGAFSFIPNNLSPSITFSCFIFFCSKYDSPPMLTISSFVTFENSNIIPSLLY